MLDEIKTRGFALKIWRDEKRITFVGSLFPQLITFIVKKCAYFQYKIILLQFLSTGSSYAFLLIFQRHWIPNNFSSLKNICNIIRLSLNLPMFFKTLTVNQPLNYFFTFFSCTLENGETRPTLSKLIWKAQMFNRVKKPPLYSFLPICCFSLATITILFHKCFLSSSPNPILQVTLKPLV